MPAKLGRSTGSRVGGGPITVYSWGLTGHLCHPISTAKSGHSSKGWRMRARKKLNFAKRTQFNEEFQ